MLSITGILNEMNGDLCTYRLNLARSIPEDGEMNEITGNTCVIGRLYAQLDQPPKVRFEIYAIKVYGLL